jgi:hypothetical protein
MNTKVRDVFFVHNAMLSLLKGVVSSFQVLVRLAVVVINERSLLLSHYYPFIQKYNRNQADLGFLYPLIILLN